MKPSPAPFSLDTDGAQRVTYNCPLCGHHFEFDPERNSGGCSSCPLGKGCGLVLCPNCRYEFPEESRVVNWLTRMFKGKKKAETPLLWENSPGEIPLSDLGLNKVGEVVSFRFERQARADRLSAMGLTPGCRVKVMQKFPSVVIAIGETEVALDRAITQEIIVRPTAPEG